MRRVAITGLGVVSALGIGVEAFWEGLTAGRSGIRRITLFDPSALTINIAAEVPGYDPAQYFPAKKLDLLDRFSQFALVAAGEAMRDAGLRLEGPDRARCGAAMGTGMGGAATEDEGYLNVYGRGAARVHPFTIPRLMHNAAAAHMSMELGLEGPTLVYSTACASASHAIGEAGEVIRAGRADIMLAGGSEAPITFAVMKAWEAMRVMAPPPDGDPSTACRPFSADRQGLVMGEGAGVLVLEEWERARRRGARIHAELAGYGATADAGHITQMALEPPARAIRLALEQAGLEPAAIGYVNAHGTATRLNDASETAVIKEVFGEHARKLAISSTKSMHGHAMGASGALELAAAVLALERETIPPTANYTTPDPECDLDYVPNLARPLRFAAALSNSFAFGGLNAALVVTRTT
jgi:beta-ketoacyl-acyl-carrier-protein synthase II